MTNSPRLRVLSLPGKNYPGNKYCKLFCKGLESADQLIINIRDGDAALFRFDVLHLHWPEHYVTERGVVKATCSAIAFSAFLLASRLLGKKVVWTVHDVVPFNVRNTWLLWTYLKFVRSLISGYVFLNQSSARQFFELYPGQTIKPSCEIMHGPYEVTHLSAGERQQIRRQMMKHHDNFLVAYLGDIKAYKNLDSVSVIPTETHDGKAVEILVAGRTDPAANESMTKQTLSRAGNHRVIRINERLTDNRLAELVQAADAVILPYTRGSNSGFAMLVLSCCGRIVSSCLPMFTDLAQAVGKPWIFTTDFEAGTAQVSGVLRDFAENPQTLEDKARLDTFLAQVAFEKGAKTLVNFYRGIDGHRKSELQSPPNRDCIKAGAECRDTNKSVATVTTRSDMPDCESEGKLAETLIGDPPAARPSALSPRSRFQKLVSASKLAFTVGMGHGVVQLLGVLTSIFLVRRMNISDYAQYSLALGFQTTAISLTNLGLTESIIPLVGSRARDHKLVGNYVQSAKHLRTKLFISVAPCCVVIFLLTARKHQWAMSSQLILLTSILLSIYLSASLSCYSAPLILNRRLLDYYKAQVGPALARLVAYIIAALAGVLGAGVASIVGAVSLLLGSRLAMRNASSLLELPRHSDKQTNQEIVRCMLPMIPTAIFVSFHPQLSLFMVSAFGQTLQIAQVAALNKIGQFFLIFNTLNTLVVEPYVAKVTAERLLSVYIGVIGYALSVAVLLTLFAFSYPSLLTSPLGPQYSELDKVVPWVVLGSSVNIVSSAIWVMNRSRKWIFWRGSAAEIGCILLTQTIFVLTVGVHTTKNAVIFSLVASASSLIAQGYVMFFGFTCHRHSQQHLQSVA